MGDGLHSSDDGGLEGRLRVVAVADGVEAVGDEARLVGLAVAGGEGRAELGLIAVGGLVEIDVEEEAPLEASDQPDQRGGLLGGGVVDEGAVGVDGLGVPAVDHLIAPGAHAGGDEEVDPVEVGRRPGGEEGERTLNAARLVAVDPAGDQRPRSPGEGLGAPNREEGVASRIEAQRPVSLDRELGTEGLELGDDLLFVASLDGP